MLLLNLELLTDIVTVRQSLESVDKMPTTFSVGDNTVFLI